MEQIVKLMLIALGLATITSGAAELPGSRATQRSPGRAGAPNVHHSNDGCEFKASLDRTAWEVQPYLRGSYRRTPAPPAGDLQLHFLVQRPGPSADWDEGCRSETVGEETAPTGLRIVYRLATCPRRAAAIPEPPAHAVRLYADFEARLYFTVALSSPNRDLLLAHQRELSEIARSVRAVHCVGLGN